VLAPVLITQGQNGASDSVRVLGSSGTTGFSVTSEIIAPFYNPSATGTQRTTFTLPSSVGFSVNDLVAVFYPATFTCQVFQVTGLLTTLPGVGVLRADNATWNAPGFPNAAVVAPPPGPTASPPQLINLGTLGDWTFSVSNNFRLQMSTFNLAARSTTVQALQSNIVALRAFYGKDTTGAGAVTRYDQTTPTTNAGWQQILSVRVAVLARSAQYEKDIVTSDLPTWDVGKVLPVAGSAACGTSQCITMNANVSTDWQHYRYKVYTMTVPLRNMQWHST